MKHKKDSKKHHHFILKISITIIVVVLLLSSISSLFDKAKDHKQAVSYFKDNNLSNLSIQEWMNSRMIIKEFGITTEEFDNTINSKLNPKERGKSLLEICKQKEINCTQLISELNLIHQSKKNKQDKESTKTKKE